MTRIPPLVAFALLLALLAAPLQAERRIALVIGNGAYRTIGSLANPVRDADLVAAALARQGFAVSAFADLTEDGMDAALDDFAILAQDADVAAVYFAGHGIQHDAVNYLMPVDARLTSAALIAREGVALDEVLALLAEVPVSLVFVDACRNNPFAQSLQRERGNLGGLAVVRAPGDTLVVYATQPNTTATDGAGENSPFARALARHMVTPDLEVSVMMKRVSQQVYDETGREQRPQQVSTMLREFYFARSRDNAPAERADYRGVLSVYPPRVRAGDEVSVLADVPGTCTPSFFNIAPDGALTPIPRRYFRQTRHGTMTRYEISPGSPFGLVIEETDAPGLNRVGYLCDPDTPGGEPAKTALLQAILRRIETGAEEGRVSAGGFVDVAFQVRPFEIR